MKYMIYSKEGAAYVGGISSSNVFSKGTTTTVHKLTTAVSPSGAFQFESDTLARSFLAYLIGTIPTMEIDLAKYEIHAFETYPATQEEQEGE